jgi:hypothetical protein
MNCNFVRHKANNTRKSLKQTKCWDQRTYKGCAYIVFMPGFLHKIVLELYVSNRKYGSINCGQYLT